MQRRRWPPRVVRAPASIPKSSECGGMMRFPVQAIQRYVAGFLVLLLSAPFGEAAGAQQQQSSAAQEQTAQAQTPPPGQSRTDQQQIAANDSQGMPDAPTPAVQSADQNQQQQNPPAAGAEQQSTSPAVGTAAAPLERPSGVAVSRPEGAAIAPAKQRRVRTFLISIGVVIGAGVAIVTVAALSHASPSRP